MLWAVGGKPRLLVPSRLWQALTEEQRAVLLLHELAHLRRCDHWVRGLEIVTTCLYWWHPVVWWARRELREAEEQCCDAWVVWALPRSARAYALALVETLDFLSEARPALPAAASGVGHVHDLRRRLTMIMRGSTPRRLTWGGFLAVLGVGAVLLPLVPTWAQDSPNQPPKIQRGEAKPGHPAQRDDAEHARAALAQAEAQLEQSRAQVAQAREQLRLAQQAAGRRGDGGQRRMVIIIQDDRGREIRRIEVNPGDVIRVPGEAPRGGDRPRSEPPQDPANRDNAPRVDGPRAAGSAPRAVGPGGAGGPMVPSSPPAAGQPGRALGVIVGPGTSSGAVIGGRPGGQPPGHDDYERRLQRLEEKFDAILRDLERLRRELRRDPGDRPEGARPGAGSAPRRDRDDGETRRTPRREIRVEEDVDVRPGPDRPTRNIEKKIERREPRSTTPRPAAPDRPSTPQTEPPAATPVPSAPTAPTVRPPAGAAPALETPPVPPSPTPAAPSSPAPERPR
jgi:hypothetical protein